MAQFMHQTSALRGSKSYVDLHAWSIQENESFWSSVWDFCGVIGDKGSRASRKTILPEAIFFPEAKLNLAENFLKKMKSLYVLSEGAEERAQEYTSTEVAGTVASLVELFNSSGISSHDSIVSILPVGIEALAFAVAGFEIGAVVASASPEFGDEAILSRFSQLQPKALIVCTSYVWQGKSFDRRELIQSMVKSLPSLKLVILVGEDMEVLHQESNLPKIVEWESMKISLTPLQHQRRPFDHPAYVLFTSGTTGAPKGLIHRCGGILLKHRLEQNLHCDIKEGDRVMFYTTTGWMMWNWALSILASGADLFLLDGSPVNPGPLHLFHVAREQRLTHLGVSARLLDVMASSGQSLSEAGPFPYLRCLMVTGSPLSASTAMWVGEQLGEEVLIAPFSGGTDIAGCFTGPNPLEKAYAGQMQGAMLGMDVDVWDDVGNSCPPNVIGELVCKNPFPSVPLGVWGDSSGERFNASYFETWPGIWRHGDLASWTDEGGIIIHGRSDATLNIGGVRIGTGEIYLALESVPEVSEALVFTQPWDGDERIVLLVIAANPDINQSEVIERIKKTVRTACSPRHVPAQIYFARELPRTFNGKLAEVAVADLAHARPIRNLTALINPGVLDEIAALITVP